MQHQASTNTRQSSTNATGNTPAPKLPPQHDFSSLKLPSIKPYTDKSSVGIDQHSPDHSAKLLQAIGGKTVESLRFIVQCSARAFLWTSNKLLEVVGKLWHPTPKDAVDILVGRALSGPPDKYRPSLPSASRTWASSAKDLFLAVAARMEPTPCREARKIMSYESAYLPQLGALFSQLALGLPRSNGQHITPARVRALPCEYNDPHLQRIYNKLRRHHFPKRADVDDYKVVWRDRPMWTKEGSGTLRDTLGYIDYGTRTIHIAREMSHPDAVRWLPALIHHELCHAILFDFLLPTQDCHAEWFKRINTRHEHAQGFEGWRGWDACYNSYHSSTKKLG